MVRRPAARPIVFSPIIPLMMSPLVARRSFRFSALLVALVAPLLTLSRLTAADAPPAADKPTVPVVSNDQAVQKPLHELDKFLDVHPQMEEMLRANLDQMDEKAFQEKNPPWAGKLARRPVTTTA